MAWWKEYFADVDSMDMEKVGAWFAEDMNLRFGNAPAMQGRDTIIGSLRGFLSPFKSMKHEFGEVIESADGVFTEAAVTYSFPDGRAVTVPSATFMRRRGDKVSELRVFIDLTPVFAQ
jgi:ketosteroid isomerase-like protein